MKKTIEQAIKDKILWIGNKIPESIVKDNRPKFVILGNPQELINETQEPFKFNKDFYEELPSMVCEQLDKSIIPKYSDKEWFEEAWNKYREHVLNTDMDNVKMPGYIFKSYIEKELSN